MDKKTEKLVNEAKSIIEKANETLGTDAYREFLEEIESECECRVMALNEDEEINNAD